MPTDPLSTQSMRGRPISVFWPIRDDNSIPLWLVPGDWTRGRAVAHAATAEGEDFTRFRAHRVWYRWAHLDFSVAGWRLEDGTLTACLKGDADAEPYWEVVHA